MLYAAQLGATLINSDRYGEAIAALEQALVHKPNYPRGLVNFGLAMAGAGDHTVSQRLLLLLLLLLLCVCLLTALVCPRAQEAARSYVRALQLNPRAEHVW